MYEQFIARKLGIRVRVILPPEARSSFNKQLEMGKEGIKAVVHSLTDIDINKAKATVQEDEDNVKYQIEVYEAREGKLAVTDAVKESMRHWFQMEFKLHLENLENELYQTQLDGQHICIDGLRNRRRSISNTTV